MARAAMAAAVTLIVCMLIAMGCWSADKGHARDFLGDFYTWLLGSQFVLLGVWSAGTCGQAVARERELKTFDFLKITRLTPAEIMVGKLLGAPIVAYFIVACTLPISMVAGLVGGIRPVAVLGSIVLLVAFNLFYSLAALLRSMLVEKSSSGAVGLLGLIANLFFHEGICGEPFQGICRHQRCACRVFSPWLSRSGMGTFPQLFSAWSVPCGILTWFFTPCSAPGWS